MQLNNNLVNRTKVSRGHFHSSASREISVTESCQQAA